MSSGRQVNRSVLSCRENFQFQGLARFRGASRRNLEWRSLIEVISRQLAIGIHATDVTPIRSSRKNLSHRRRSDRRRTWFCAWTTGALILAVRQR